MSEEEFWDSTLARVTELYRVQVLDWNRTRDYFPALTVATAFNATRTKQTDKSYSAEDILLGHYPPKRQQQTHDPDFGAVSDWQGLRTALKGHTQAKKRSKAKLKPHAKL